MESSGQKRQKYDEDDPEEDPRRKIPELFRLFYGLGWTVGAGGSLSIRKGNEIYFPPSGVQKEKIKPEQMFVTDMKGEVVSGPEKLKISTCKPVFMKAYQHRDSGAAMHTHSPNAVLITMLYPGKEFRITHQQALLGIAKCSSGRNYRFHEELVVPIVENALEEYELKDRIEKVILEYPDSSAALVRRHGIFIWADSWQKAKLMLEAYDYLFNIAIKMKQFGMDPAKVPTDEHEQMFVTDMKGEVVSGPEKLKISTCKPVFMKAYQHRDSGAAMHTHSPNAVLITMLYPGKEFRITHQQALLGIAKCSSGRNYRFHEELVVPIVENALEEYELKDRIEKVILEYPDSSAALVRRHGIFIWADSWQKAKLMLEAYDYLFNIAIKMKQFGMDPAKVPTDEHGII